MWSITVIIISYNQEDDISRCLDSILIQKDFGLKHIVVSDDCSKDKTWDILCSYAKRYPEIMVINRNDQNLGIYPNSDKALSLRGDADLFCLIAGDDALCNGWFERIQLFLNEKSIDINVPIGIYSDWIKIDKEGRTYVYTQSMVNEGYNPFDLFIRGYVSDRSFLMNNALLQKNGQTLLGRGLNLTEWAWESLKHKYIEKAYYIPFIGSIYYSGIGVSKRLTLKDSDYHTVQEIEKWEYFKKHYLKTPANLYYADYGIERAKYYMHPSIYGFLRILYYYYKGKLDGESKGVKHYFHFIASLINYARKFFFSS